ncbi:MAG: Holliday junction branch migration protein RuvA, partial [Bacteroides sp.]
GNTARMILSSLSPVELVEAIGSKNAKLLQSVKGIGKKTAERIIVDLKDKIKTTALVEDGHLELADVQSPDMDVYDEAVSALTMLGFAPAPTRKVVGGIFKENPKHTVEELVKLALKKL